LKILFCTSYFDNTYNWWSALMFSNNTKVLGFIQDDSFIHYNLRSFRWTTSWLYRYFYHLAELIAANLVDTVFSNSNYLKKEIESKYNIHPKKVKKIYPSIDIAVANMEGLAHGIPIVATNVGGIPEVTKGNHCAWIAEPSNPKSLASAICKCIESPVERLEKSLTGRKHVETHFNYHQMLTETVTILENLSC